MTALIVPAGTVGYRPNPPRGWHEQRDGALVCPHRDLSVCPTCDAETPEAVEVYGAHFWIATPEERAEFAALSAETESEYR